MITHVTANFDDHRW